MTQVAKYEPKLVVQFYDNTKAYINAKNKNSFKKAINSDRFVEIEGVLYNTREIRHVYDKNPKKKEPVWQPPA